MADVGIGFVDILPRTDKFVSSLTTQMNKGLGTVSSQASTTSKVLSGVSTGFLALGAAAVAGIAKAVESTVEWSREVLTLQRVTGQSAESASALLAVMGEFGLSAQQATVGLGIFDKNIINNTTNLTKYGIATTDAQGNLLPFDTILGNAADKFVSLGNAQKQAAFVMNAFGRSGKALIPILRQGSAGLEELKQEASATGLVIGQDTVNAAVELGHQQRELNESFKGLAVTIGQQFLPIATDLIEAFKSFVQVLVAIPGPVKEAGLGFLVLTGALALTQKLIAGVAGVWGGLVGAIAGGTAAETAAVDTTVALAAAIETLNATLTQQVATTGAADAALVGYGATESGLIVPTEALTAAQTELAGATEAANIATAGTAAAGGASLGILARLALVVKGAAGALGIAAGAYALGSVSTVKLGDDTEKLTSIIGDAQLDYSNLKAGIDVYDSSLVQGAEATKEAIKWDREQAVALGASGAAFDYAVKHAVPYDEALQEVTKHAKSVGDTIRVAFSSVTDQAAALGEVAGGVDLLNATLLTAQVRLSRFADRAGADVKSILGSIAKVVSDPKATIANVVEAYQGGIAQLIAANRQWHDSLVQSFGGAGSVLEKFADKSNVNIGNAVSSLQKYTGQLKSFGNNIATIQDRFGKKANDFIQWASEQGLAQRGLVERVASGNKKMGDSFISNFNRANAATDTLASQIQHALDPVFNRIILQLKNVVRAIEGLPPIKLHADTSAAQSTVQQFIAATEAQRITIQADVRFNAQQPRATGGPIFGMPGFAGGGSTDTVPAMLTPGEFVMRKSAVDRIGVPALTQMNAGGPVTQISKPQKLDGTLRISDWRTGLTSLDAELSWEDTVRTR